MRPALPLPHAPPTDGVVALRPWREADVAAVATWGQDPEIVRWTAVPVDQTADTVHAYLRRAERAREVGLFVALAIVDAESDEVIGSCDVRRPDPTDLAIGELGYVLIAGARGRGLATRAVRLLTDWGFGVSCACSGSRRWCTQKTLHLAGFGAARVPAGGPAAQLSGRSSRPRGSGDLRRPPWGARPPADRLIHAVPLGSCPRRQR